MLNPKNSVSGLHLVLLDTVHALDGSVLVGSLIIRGTTKRYFEYVTNEVSNCENRGGFECKENLGVKS